MEKTGIHLEKYCLLKEIGRGGCATVYLAVDERLGQKWAVKKIEKSQAGEVREWEILKKLNYPAFPRIVDVLSQGDTLYLVMEYVEGKNLQEEYKMGIRLSEETLLELGLCLCGALEYLHACSPPVIYRDLKPSNIIHCPDGSFRIVDFGAAALFRGGAREDRERWGTKGFCAPEQMQGKCCAQSDIYSMGKTLAYLGGDTVSRKFQRILNRCTRQDPGKRYASARETKNRIEKLLREKRQNHRLRRISILVLAGGVLAGIVYGIFEQAERRQYVYWMNQARSAAALGGSHEAEVRRYYETAIRFAPENDSGFLELLSYYGKEGETQRGISVVKEIMAVYAQNSKAYGDVWEEIGFLYLGGNPAEEGFCTSDEKAADAFSHAADAGIAMAGKWRRTAELISGADDPEEEELLKENLNEMEQETERLPEQARIRRMLILAQIYRRLDGNTGGEEMEQAVRILEHAQSMASDLGDRETFRNVRLQLAQMYYACGLQKQDSGMMKRAMQNYEMLIQEEGIERQERQILLKLAYGYRVMEDWEAAAAWYRKIIELYPEEPEGYSGYGWMLLLNGDAEQAEEICRAGEAAADVDGDINFLRLKERLDVMNE